MRKHVLTRWPARWNRAARRFGITYEVIAFRHQRTREEQVRWVDFSAAPCNRRVAAAGGSAV